jgi:hypothetical protein
LRNLWNALLWSALAFGVVVNLWALWVMLPEIGKELFRFGQLPDVSSSSGFLESLKTVVTLGWLPKDALHIHLFRKLFFAACNTAFLLVVFNFYTRGRRCLAMSVGALVLVTLALVFSPAVGNL